MQACEGAAAAVSLRLLDAGVLVAGAVVLEPLASLPAAASIMTVRVHLAVWPQASVAT